MSIIWTFKLSTQYVHSRRPSSIHLPKGRD